MLCFGRTGIWRDIYQQNNNFCYVFIKITYLEFPPFSMVGESFESALPGVEVCFKDGLNVLVGEMILVKQPSLMPSDMFFVHKVQSILPWMKKIF